ncbi:hypothetical protein FRC03_000736 [Tulasnella sp. 419]|nr:hypothetical protein FRC03_000736 [Tulasnella sp. 419]
MLAGQENSGSALDNGPNQECGVITLAWLQHIEVRSRVHEGLEVPNREKITDEEVNPATIAHAWRNQRNGVALTIMPIATATVKPLLLDV